MAKHKGQTDKALHRKLKMEHHESYYKPGVNSDAPDE
jgi:hypothetical protein